MSYHRASDETGSWLCEVFFQDSDPSTPEIDKPHSSPSRYITDQKIKNSF